MRKIWNTLLILSLISAGFSTTVSSNTSIQSDYHPLRLENKVITSALNYLRKQQTKDGCIGSFSVSAGAAIAISSAGENPHTWGKLVEYLRKGVNLINPDEATDWERQLLAIVACGENPRSFGGVNYLMKVKSFYDGVQIGNPMSTYDDIFDILSIISAGVDRNSTIIQTTKTHIEDEQDENGGWGDVDTTAAAVMALIAAAENKNSEVIKKTLLFS